MRGGKRALGIFYRKKKKGMRKKKLWWTSKPVELVASFPPYLSFFVAPSCCEKISRCTIKVTMMSHSLAVSAIGSDWPAFKGRDYQQAGS